jgi:hypothetical protein
MTTYLSTNFTLEEMTASQTAARQGLDNDPPPEVQESLRFTCYGMEEVRKELGDKAILISSGYRSPALNKAVGGKPNSQHQIGQAVDFTCPSFGTVDEVVQRLLESNIQFDQCIREFGRWVHISFVADNPRRMALIIDQTGTRAYA